MMIEIGPELSFAVAMTAFCGLCGFALWLLFKRPDEDA